MSNISIGSEGANALAPYLANLTSLKMLVLDSSSIGDEGAKVLAHHFCSCLEHLTLSENIIGDEGVKALAPRLANLTT